MTARKAAAGVAAFAVIITATILWHTPDSKAANPTSIDITIAGWLNGERRYNGVQTIPIDGDLTNQAALQAGRMSQCQCLYHSSQGEMGWWLNRGWWRVSENVGATSGGGTAGLYQVHLAFVASPGHRANMLDPNVDAVGIAVRTSPDGRQWVAEFFGGT